MRFFGFVVHRGDCPIRIRELVRYREGREWRALYQVAMDDGHSRNCERVTHPRSAHPCDCGLPNPTEEE